MCTIQHIESDLPHCFTSCKYLELLHYKITGALFINNSVQVRTQVQRGAILPSHVVFVV